MIEITKEMIARGLEKAKEIERSNVQACMDEFSKLGQRSYPPEQMIEAVLKAALDFSDSEMACYWHISFRSASGKLGHGYVGTYGDAISPKEVDRIAKEKISDNSEFIVTSVTKIGFMPINIFD